MCIELASDGDGIQLAKPGRDFYCVMFVLSLLLLVHTLLFYSSIWGGEENIANALARNQFGSGMVTCVPTVSIMLTVLSQYSSLPDGVSSVEWPCGIGPRGRRESI